MCWGGGEKGGGGGVVWKIMDNCILLLVPLQTVAFHPIFDFMFHKYCT